MLVLASLGSWLPFAIVAILIVLFSIIFTTRYQQKRNRDYLVTLVCSTSLIIALLTASLLPTDVILVSFMKNSNGTFKEWAQNQTTRDHIQDYIDIGYYILYGLVIAMAFLVNPFLFFYYEEKEELDIKLSTKICAALKWTSGFLIFLIILIVLGIFVPQLATLPTDNSTSEWDNVKYLINHFDSLRVQDSISFAIFTLSIIGFFLLTIYTGYGSIACPLFLIRGKRSARLQQQTIEEQRAEIFSQMQTLKNRYPRHIKMPSTEKRKLADLEQKYEILARNEESIKIVRRSFFFKCRYIYRPVQIILGVLLLLFALLIFVSLLLSNINKCIHFINFKQIFAQGNHTLPNPIDIVLTWTGQFYPMSYIVLSLLLIYIIVTSIFGLQQLGIWYFCVRMYKFSRGRTKPQAILILCSLMMFIVVAINVFVYLLIPQYAIYGDQHYAFMAHVQMEYSAEKYFYYERFLDCNDVLSSTMSEDTLRETFVGVRNLKDGTVTIKACTQYVTTDQCQMTVMGRIILRFFYKVWFFGAVYFLLSWFYLLMFLISCLVVIIRNRESNIHEDTSASLLEDDYDEDAPLIQ